nr:hypothetical protein CFP56_03808 [Quercus suber]
MLANLYNPNCFEIRAFPFLFLNSRSFLLRFNASRWPLPHTSSLLKQSMAASSMSPVPPGKILTSSAACRSFTTQASSLEPY